MNKDIHLSSPMIKYNYIGGLKLWQTKKLLTNFKFKYILKNMLEL